MSRTFKGLLSLAVVTVLAAGLYYCLAFSAETMGPSAPITTGQARAGEARPDQGDLPDPIAPENLGIASESLTSNEESTRHPVEGRYPQGRVLDSDGRPLAGAWIGWTSAWLPVQDGEPNWNALEWAEILGKTASVRSVADGSFSFAENEAVEVSDRSSIWVMAPEHGLWARSYLAIDESTCALMRAEPLAIHVYDEIGRPVEGARVRWLVATPESPAASALSKEVALAAFEYTTDSDGSAAAVSAAGRMHLVASKNGRVSSPWFGDASSPSATLFLASSFSARGRISGAEPSDHGVMVHVRIVTDDLDSGLATARVDTEGAWRIQAIPSVTDARYVFRLESRNSVPVERTVVNPPPGSEVVVDFPWIAGVTNTVLVQNTAEDPIRGARVRLLWKDGGATHASETLTDDEGMARFECSPAGEVWFEGEADGYAAERTMPYLSPLSEHFNLVLKESSRIVGRCTLDGEPVESFTVHYFAIEPTLALRTDFRGQAEGSFVLPNVPSGSLTLLPSAPRIPPGKAVTISVDPGNTAEVELELFAAGEAFGQVVDAATGQPLSQASAQVYAVYADRPIEPWGPSVAADQQGNLRGIAVSRIASRIEISAPGYAPDSVTRVPDPEGRLNMGVIGLRKQRPLVLRLEGQDGADYSEYSLDGEGSTTIARRQVPEDGRISLENVNPGPMVFGVYPPSQEERLDVYTVVELLRGSELVIPVHTNRSLTVKLVSKDGSPLPTEAVLGITFLSPDGYRTVHSEVMEDDEATIESITSDEVVVDISNPAGEFFGVKQFTCPPGSHASVEIPIEATERTLRFVSRDHSPIVGAIVGWSLPGDNVLWLRQQMTDEQGICQLRGVSAPEILATVDPPGQGIAHFLPIDLSGDAGQTIEVVVETSAGFTVRLLDHEQPMPNVDLGVFALDGVTLLARSESETDGIATVDSFAEGDFLAVLLSEGFWPAEMRAHASSDNTGYTLQVRRLGSLTIHSTQDGAALPAVSLELISDEFGVSLEDWLASGSIEIAGGMPITDTSGYLRVSGLPNGSYHWRARSPEGNALQGQLTVPPHAEVLLEVPFTE